MVKIASTGKGGTFMWARKIMKQEMEDWGESSIAILLWLITAKSGHFQFSRRSTS